MSTTHIERTAAGPAAGPAAGSCWPIDLERSRVEFHVKHLWGLATVTGYFEEFSGALRVAADSGLEIETTTRVDQRQLGMTWSRFGVRSPAVLHVIALLTQR